MAKPTLIFAIIDTVLRIILGYMQKDVWKIKTWKYYVIVPYASVFGILGSKVASYIAYGKFEGVRMYGTVLGVAIAIAILPFILKIPFKDLYGFSAVDIWFSIAVMKIPCIIQGCCYGRDLFINSAGEAVRFPSQIVEAALAFLIFIWFYRLGRTKYPKGAMYPLAMVYYGIFRYAADWMRGHPLEQSPFVLWIPAGRFFCILILIIGLVSLYLVLKKAYGKRFTKKIYMKSLIGKNEMA